MQTGRRTFLTSALAAVAAPVVVRLAAADAPPFVLRLHHFLSSVSTGHDKFLVPWARKVATDSGGRIRIDIFPSMQLGGAPAQLFDQARDGTADIVWMAPNATPGRFPKTEMFELPFVLSGRALVNSKALEDFGRANLMDEFRELHPLCFSCSDRGVLHTNRPIHTIDEIRDLRLHVQTRFAGEALRTLGAVGVPMPIKQIPVAITQHVIDGCVDPWHLVPGLRLNDLLKAHTDFADSSLSTTTFVLAMNKQAYDRLPRDLKSVIDDNSGQPAAAAAGAMWDLQAAAVADQVNQRGDPIATLLPEAVAHWRKATEPVVELWLKEMKARKADGGKLLAGAQALVAKYADEPEPQPAQSLQAPQPTEPPQPAPASGQINPPAAVASPPAPPAPAGANPAAMVTPKVSVATPAPATAPVASAPTPPAAAAPPAPSAPIGANPAAAVTPKVSVAAPAPATAPIAPPPTPPAAIALPPVAKPVLPAPPKPLDIPL